MKKAIILSYVTEQNEPSIPQNILLEIPDDPAEREAVLRNEWDNHFDGWDEDTLVITEECAYGDLCIHDANGDCFIFFTYVNMGR